MRVFLFIVLIFFESIASFAQNSSIRNRINQTMVGDEVLVTIFDNS